MDRTRPPFFVGVAPTAYWADREVGAKVLSPGLDGDALRAWLSENLGFEGKPFSVETISGGRSNLTLGVEAGGRRLVVRRPPIGHFLPTAHDMSREYRVYRALHGTGVPVPEAYALCEDESVIGAPFYVMERLDGIVPHEPGDLVSADAAANARTGTQFADVLAAIHGVDLEAAGLAGFGKPAGYLERQVSRWTDQWDRSKQADEPAIDALAAHLRRTMPEQLATTLVHGDYRLGNVMLEADGVGRIIAVFDWEMSTLGDPLSDVGYTLLWWGTTDRIAVHPSQGVADLPGFPSATQLLDRYAASAGRDVAEIGWYVALAAFKLAVIREGQRATLRRAGQPSDSATGQPLAEWAMEFIWR
ncbi:MAG TPA: phosphotransferase family protein [Solirubrobacteraceae bacterium]|jgi:aminoglycoside phosphotransferase (APT) family kinase protein